MTYYFGKKSDWIPLLDKSAGALHIDIFHSDNSTYGTEWNGVRLNDDYHRLYFIAEGEAEVTYNETTQKLVAGHTYLFPTTTLFRYACPSHLRLLNVCFKMTLDNGLDALDLHPFHVIVPAMDMTTTLNKMVEIDALVQKRSFAHQLSIRGQILTLLGPHFQASDTEKLRKRRKDMKRLAPALRYIEQNLETGITVADLPRLAAMSRSYFAKKFTMTFGMSPQDYIRKQRIELVKRELRLSSQPISNLAEDLGFSSASHMSREFKHHTGYTPKQFRAFDRFFD